MKSQLGQLAHQATMMKVLTILQAFGRTTVELLRRIAQDTNTGEVTVSVLKVTGSGEPSRLVEFIQPLIESPSAV